LPAPHDFPPKEGAMKRTLKLLTLATLFVLLTAIQIWALDGQEYSKLTELYQQMYVLGVIDGLSVLVPALERPELQDGLIASLMAVKCIQQQQSTVRIVHAYTQKRLQAEHGNVSSVANIANLAIMDACDVEKFKRDAERARH
jgi:hypothetical protein